MEDLQHLLTLAAIATEIAAAVFFYIAFPLYAWKRSTMSTRSTASTQPEQPRLSAPVDRLPPVDIPVDRNVNQSDALFVGVSAPKKTPVDLVDLVDREILEPRSQCKPEWQPLPISLPDQPKRKRGRPRKVA